MRKIETKKEIKEVINKKERVFCDLCGKEAIGNDWNGTEIEIDICPDCFRNKLIPWLESQGVSIEERR